MLLDDWPSQQVRGRSGHKSRDENQRSASNHWKEGDNFLREKENKNKKKQQDKIWE